MVLPALASAADNKPGTQSRDATMPPPAASGSAAAQTRPMDTPPQAARSAADAPPYSDRARMNQWTSEKEQLENALKAGIGKDRTFARQEIEKHGYRITAVNKDKPDELEYEVVKGTNSFEVQFDFDKNGMAKEVDVSTNMWKADSTKQALKDADYKYAYPKSVGAGAAVYSDSTRMKGWTGEKEQLEKALTVGQSKEYYPAALTKRGYQVTSVNESKADYVEYEVIKGDHSYEVQVDFDKATGKRTKVDVTSNLWENEATDRAMDKKEARKQARATN
jgi:hypothetical protein